MKTYPLTITLAICCLSVLLSCKKNKTQSDNDGKAITSFQFKTADNPGIKVDVNGLIDPTADTIRVSLPQGTDLSHLVPTITYNGVSINPGSKTAEDFSTGVRYTVTAKDGSSQTYTVVVRLLSNTKAILSFILRTADNPGLGADVTGVIKGDTIDLYVDPAVDLTHLVPAITDNGSRISPGSGTAQNFSSPIQYTVTAEDGTTNTYTVIASGNVTVYVGSTDNYLYAIDAASGALRWKAATTGAVNSSPTVAGGTVYVGSDDSYFYAFDAATGQLRWKVYTYGAVDGNPTAAGGMVYLNILGATPNGNTLAAFDTATGTQQWSATLTGSYTSQSPTIVNGTVYITDHINGVTLQAFDAATGAPQWQLNTFGDFDFNPAVVNGTIYMETDYNPMAAVDVQTQTLKWLYVERDPYGNTITVFGSGSPTVDGPTVFGPTSNNEMYALDTTAGTLKWKFSTSNSPAGGQFSSPVAGSGLLFATNTNGLLYAMDEKTGVTQWTYGTTVAGTQPAGNPVYANGVVYTGNHSGNFCAISALTGALKWSFQTSGTVTSGACVTDVKGNSFHPGNSGDRQ